MQSLTYIAAASLLFASTSGGAGDKLHPNRTGYLAMGQAIDLDLFKPVKAGSGAKAKK